MAKVEMIRHCLRGAEAFSEGLILSAVDRQLE